MSSKKRKKADNRPIWTGDCETDPFLHGRTPRPFIWGLWTGISFHEFDTAAEFADFVRDCEAIVYFHNGGKFDFHYMLKEINLYEEIKVIDGRLVVAKIGKCELRDSWKLLPIPLAEYKKDDFDYRILEHGFRDQPQNRAKIREYLRNDCLFLHNLIMEFTNRYGRHLTIAGAALQQWRKLTTHPVPDTDRHFFAHFSPYYFGGRVQCFQRGKIEGPCNVYDIRSAYPEAMLSAHPYYTDYVTTKNPNSFRPTSMVKVDCVSLGCLPYRTEMGAMIFPDDDEVRRYFVTGHELQAGLDTGTVRDVTILETHDFGQLVDFREYIEPIYAERMEARTRAKDERDPGYMHFKATVIFCKLFMNNLYGKFASNPDNYGNFICVDFDTFEDYLTDGYEFNGMIGPHALLRAPLDEWQCKFLNVATAASITGMVRAKLWRAIYNAVDPIYCDTDSLICRVADLDIGEHLGQWQHEGTATAVHIAGKKMYVCDGLYTTNVKGEKVLKQATKGVKLSPQQIRNAAAGFEVLYEPDVPTYSLKSRKKDASGRYLVSEPKFINRRVKATK